MRTGIVLLLALATLTPAALGIRPDAVDGLGAPDSNRYIVAFEKDPFLKVGQTYAGERIVAVDHDLIYVIVQVRDHALFSARVTLDDNVRYVQWDNPAYATISLVPNDSRYGDAGHWGSKKIGAEQAWDRTTGSTSVKVAMIDSGLNKGHEDITGSRVLQGYDYHNGDTDPNDESGCSWHGTHTTGTAGATINNAKGIAGISQHTILPFKALGSSFFGCTGSSSGLANALKAAGDQGAHVSSNSWGGGGVDSLLNDAIQYAHDRGVIHIAAAGNSGPCTNCVSEPWKSKASIVTIVASTTQSDGQSSFSSEGAEIDVAAPGSDILSTTSGTTGYGSLSGTSMATPHVAGVAALLKAVNPSWTFSQVDGQLKSTAVDLGPAGHDHDFGYGRINAAAAVGGGTTTYQCNDGLDNDGDGLVDLNDPGCSSSTDNDETNSSTSCSGPANNCFASPTSVAAGGGSTSQSTTGATLETGEPRPCASIGGTVWFTWTPTASGTATIDTMGSGYDTALAVYTGSSLGGLTTVGCNDDISSSDLDSRVSFTATAGVTYRIQAGGYNGATGSLTLRVTAPAACSGPANNCFSSPTSVAKGSSTSQSTSGATLETGEPRPCASIGGTVWFTYTPSASGTVTIDTMGSGYDTALAVYTGSSLTGLTNVACNDDISSTDLDSRVSFSGTAGVTYRIQAGGYNGATGSLVLRVN
ncbi:MAG TPA: S8 family serine peptidase [Candidatus Thermoplasmatota archaeon]|nr:S8 family serine peptidase [Candidatus Thermoplasmatota archaeon]